MAEMSRPETCDKCTRVALRKISGKTMFIGEKVEDAYFNHGLGTVIRSRRHKDEVAKEKGLIEIGNEKPETLAKLADRNKEDNRKKYEV